MNNYHKDSFIFFQEVAKRAQKDISKGEVIQLGLNLALGCERLLKGILYDVNPIYVMIEPDFKHTIQTIYSSRIIDGLKQSKELAKDPNSDVITFSNSIIKAQFVSKVVFDHKNVLFSIGRARDIIAHCELSLLDINNLKEIIIRDFYTMIDAFANELKISSSKYFENQEIKLAKLSGSLQTDLKQKIKLLLESHLKTWQGNKDNEDYVSKKRNITQNVYATDEKDKVICPACLQTALVYLRAIMEFNPNSMEIHLMGYEARKLRCFYCKLEVIDPSVLDYLNI
ncbi:MAG: hypothetical protein EOO43_04090 [Flavobacterium sp.]|nr:MAG: hypothetical protein EOO43_04090 [Flavobacterium sp.]